MPGTIRFIEDVALADAAIEVTAPTLNELFETAALALTQVMTDPAKVRPETPVSIRVEADDLEALLVRFLSDLVYRKDADRLLFGTFRVRVAEETARCRLEASVSGEPIDPVRHDLRSDVKAVTYHRLSVAKDDAGWTATFVLDI